MGVLNVTPDSFSDGGRFLDPDAAVTHGLRMWAEGADLVDVGGESTRPGSEAVDAATEIGRVLPVIAPLAAEGVAVSVDTSKPEVAAAALDAGAVVVNDVRALRGDGMAEVVGSAGCGLVLMHMLGEPRTMQDDPTYDDVVAEVTAFLVGRAAVAREAGVLPHLIALDPGIGFGKTVAHNLTLLVDGVRALAATGHPVLVGASRKSFLAALIGQGPPEGRDAATVAVHTLAVASGATAVRAHDVRAAVRATMAADAIVRNAATR
jgi:dihydropteroate synthase